VRITFHNYRVVIFKFILFAASTAVRHSYHFVLKSVSLTMSLLLIALATGMRFSLDNNVTFTKVNERSVVLPS